MNGNDRTADRARAAALDQIDKSERNFKRAIALVTVCEAAFLALLVTLADFHDRTQVLIFVSAIGTYGIGILAVFALGAHLNRKFQMLLRALDARD